MNLDQMVERRLFLAKNMLIPRNRFAATRHGEGTNKLIPQNGVVIFRYI